MIKQQKDLEKMRELKSIQTAITKAKEELKAAQLASTQIIQQITNTKQRIKDLNQKVQSLSNNDIVVSEHAMLRYIERVMHIDMQELKERVLPTEATNDVKTLGQGTYPVGTHSVVIQDGVVTTIKIYGE